MPAEGAFHRSEHAGHRVWGLWADSRGPTGLLEGDGSPSASPCKGAHGAHTRTAPARASLSDWLFFVSATDFTSLLCTIKSGHHQHVGSGQASHHLVTITWPVSFVHKPHQALPKSVLRTIRQGGMGQSGSFQVCKAPLKPVARMCRLRSLRASGGSAGVQGPEDSRTEPFSRAAVPVLSSTGMIFFFNLRCN